MFTTEHEHSLIQELHVIIRARMNIKQAMIWAQRFQRLEAGHDPQHINRSSGQMHAQL
jgi:hypothetical protein